MSPGRPLPDPSGKARRALERALRRGRAKGPERLTRLTAYEGRMPCGCRPNRTEVFGILGEKINGISSLDVTTGQLVFPVRRKNGESLGALTIECPFEVRCIKHGPQGAT